MTDKTSFGDRMKMYEKLEAGRRFMPGLPIYARIDGKCFSKFTKGMDRPFDRQMSEAMIGVTEYLVEKTGALMGYTQSDEISLVWFSDNADSQIFFDGKIQKMVSVLAAMATARFGQYALARWPLKVASELPVFDCRVFALPNKTEAANAFLWREQDATKNAISMAARTVYSHKELMHKNGNEMQEMLWQKDINFNDYPSFFKRGTFIQRKKVMRDLTEEELSRIPEKHRPDGPIERTEITRLDMPIFSTVTNRVEVIFDGEDPEVKNAFDA